MPNLNRSPGPAPNNRATRSNSETCRICKKKDANQNELKLLCHNCKHSHHLQCAGVTLDFF